jgi:hypothetical protein
MGSPAVDVRSFTSPTQFSETSWYANRLKELENKIKQLKIVYPD